jgi:hypothetical protein
MSALMVMASFMQPKALLVSVTDGGAETTATGLPSLIINKGFLSFLLFVIKTNRLF